MASVKSAGVGARLAGFIHPPYKKRAIEAILLAQALDALRASAVELFRRALQQ